MNMNPFFVAVGGMYSHHSLLKVVTPVPKDAAVKGRKFLT
jgi:hypothetical protein